MTETAKPKQKKSLLPTSALGIFGLITLTSLFYADYSATQSKMHISAIKKEQSETNAQVDARFNELRDEQQTLKQDFVNLTKQVVSVEKETPEPKWDLLKARYYLELANINTQWSDNPAVSIALLQQADKILATHNEPNLVPIRQAITNEVISLNAYSPVDIAGILIQLNALEEADIHLAQKTPLMPVKTQANPSQKIPSTWRERLYANLNQLKQLVIIHHRDNSIEPILTQSDLSRLHARVQLYLQRAQWAILQHHQAVYDVSLKQALHAMQRIEQMNTPEEKALIVELSTLQTLQLSHQKPSPGEALSLLNQFIHEQTS
jgi:uroporphyrin-3 C-methyltransferase